MKVKLKHHHFDTAKEIQLQMVLEAANRKGLPVSIPSIGGALG